MGIEGAQKVTRSMPDLIVPTRPTFRRLSSAIDGAQLRSATFDNDSYLVVPVVALVGDVIVRPLNSLGPELVPAHELSIAPIGWNNRPVLPDHPNNGLSSANEPRTLELYRFGHLFNTRYEDGRLKTEAWLDPARAEKVGPDAVSVIERCQAGDTVEVSVGALVILERAPGEFNGEPYEYVWHNIVPDHLAMGLGGSQGACNIEMGCGAPRVNSRSRSRIVVPTPKNQTVSLSLSEGSMPNVAKPVLRVASDAAEGSNTEPTPDTPESRSLMRRMFSSLSSVFRSSMLNSELSVKLTSALMESEPGFSWLEDYDPDVSTVIYAVYVTYGDIYYGGKSEVFYYQRSYKLDAQGNVTLKDDTQPVERAKGWEVVQEAAATERAASSEPDVPSTSNSSCSCHSSSSPQGAHSMNRAAVIARLLTRSPAASRDADRRALEALSDITLQSIIDANEEEREREAQGANPTTAPGTQTPAPSTPAPTPPTVPATPATPSTPAAPTPPAQPVTADPGQTQQAPVQQAAASGTGTPLTEEQWLSQAPPSIRNIVSAARNAESIRRTNLITALVSAQTARGSVVYDQAHLSNRPTEELEGMARLLQINEPVRDYSGAGFFAAPSTLSAGPSIESFMPPNTYDKKAAN